MGYSISAPIRDIKLRDKMWSFMNEHYEEPYVLFSVEFDYSRIAKSGGSNGLSYDHGRCRIGFDYNSCAPERDYIFNVCRWISIVSGKTKSFEGIPEPVPYYIYDGYEDMPIIIRGIKGVDKKHKSAIVGKLGWKEPHRYDTKSFTGDETELEDIREAAREGKIYSKIVNPALRRLDKAWGAYNV